MRLFIAVNFDEQTKQKISQIANLLKSYGVNGNYTKECNYHITLLFLGQSTESQLLIAKKAVSEIKQNPFDITLQNISSFGKNIIYLGVNNIQPLNNINQFLYDRLKHDFLLDDDRFLPHITLIRKPDYIPASINTECGLPLFYKVKDISLMQSIRIDGKLVYKPVFSCRLSV